LSGPKATKMIILKKSMNEIENKKEKKRKKKREMK
jgi:hypothetical protein